MSHLPGWILVLSQLSTMIAGNPIFAPQFLSGGTGRNIRHLPCVSLKTGETGVCMFALTCVKANGTHLGTCIDRFYFGSCCKLNDDPEIYPEDNTIEETAVTKPFVTPDSAIESNNIPDHYTRPKPMSEKRPVSSIPTPSTQNSPVTTQTARVQTSTESQRIPTLRPYLSTPYTTTQPPIGLSTFYMTDDDSHDSSNAPTTEGIVKDPFVGSTRPQKPFTIESTTVITTNEGLHRPKPTSTVSPVTTRPVVTETTTKKPYSVYGTKLPVTRKPVSSTNTKPSSSTTERVQPSTRFPPRNATTTTRPSSPTTTRHPGQYSTTKNPPVITKRPSSPTRKPATTFKPSTNPASTAKPTITTDKPYYTNVKITQPYGTPFTSTQSPTTDSPVTASSSTAGSSTASRPSQRPWTKWPSVTNADDRVTTSRPWTASSRPRPSSKPTRISTTSSPRPTTLRTTSRPQQIVTDKPSSSSTSSSSSSSSRPSTLRPSPESYTRPRPTERPINPTKPTKSTKPTRVTVTTTPPGITISGFSSTTRATTLPSTPFVHNGSTLNNEIVPPKKSSTTTTTTENFEQTTQVPGLITWSSNSDDDVTKSPEPVPTTSDSAQNESTEPEWSPITTPDGWIIIQSPTTERPVTTDEVMTRPKPIKTTVTTSAKPTSESTTTERVTSPRPTIPTILSTIATVTTASDLPIPVETLNMSDYKQVCGRRLFPESRIVGGQNSSFGKWPWQISLRQWKTNAYLHKCGAALLNENWAITAAHCIDNVPPSNLLLRIGEHDLGNEDEPYGFQERRVQIVASHPQFDPRTFEYDVALLRFYEPLEPFQPNILPVCLPDDDENYVGHSAYVTGWGRLFEDGPLPSVLQEVSVPVINNTLCEAMYRKAGYIEHIPNIFICAGWRKGGFDSCEGDSGGPMMIRRPRDNRWILAGVISWGIGCAEANQPGVYTRISEFREWINQILQF